MPASEKVDSCDRIINIIGIEGCEEEKESSLFTVVWDHGRVQRTLNYEFVQKWVSNQSVIQSFWKELKAQKEAQKESETEMGSKD